MANQNFKFYCEKWLKQKYFDVKQSSYLKYEKIIFNRILPFFENVEITEINEDVIVEFFRKESEYSSNSILRTEHFVLKSIFKFIAILDSNLTVKFSMKIKLKKNVIKVLNIEEQKKLEKYALQNDKMISKAIIIALYTGMRLGEICALKWGDLSFEQEIINIEKTVQRVSTKYDEKNKTKLVISEPKSETSRRKIPIPLSLMNYLKLNKGIKEHYILNDKTKIVDPRLIQYHYSKLCKLLEIEHSKFHNLRHTFATNCIEKEVDAKTLSEILGHSDVSITLKLYVHSNMKLKKEQMKKFDKFLIDDYIE